MCCIVVNLIFICKMYQHKDFCVLNDKFLYLSTINLDNILSSHFNYHICSLFRALQAPNHEKILRGRNLRISPADSWHQPVEDEDNKVRWKPRGHRRADGNASPASNSADPQSSMFCWLLCIFLIKDSGSHPLDNFQWGIKSMNPHWSSHLKTITFYSALIYL